jgi:hypothetical protein
MAATCHDSGRVEIARISRSARIPAMPPASCIESAISSVDAVESVRHEVREITGLPTFGPMRRSYTAHRFFYTTSRGGAGLHILIDDNGETELEQSLCGISQTHSQDDLDAIRAVMVQIEQALESQCGLASLSNAVEEACTGVECPAQ